MNQLVTNLLTCSVVSDKRAWDGDGDGDGGGGNNWEEIWNMGKMNGLIIIRIKDLRRVYLPVKL